MNMAAHKFLGQLSPSDFNIKNTNATLTQRLRAEDAKVIVGLLNNVETTNKTASITLEKLPKDASKQEGQQGSSEKKLPGPAG